ncbi:MAG TPA: DUF4394 domain-containing protein [Mycobacteriales bacterium]|nr:DUF4394 domain-containing protein [Mycobacteriales bacterium]
MTLLRRTRTTAALAAAAGLVALAAPASAAHEDLTAAGLTSGGTKVTVLGLADGRAAQQQSLVGLEGDRRLVGIDYRVFGGDATLYGVGDGGGLYAVDPATGTAVLKGRLTVPLEGTRFGVDFNPVANALRIISDTGQNLRQPFATVVDDVAGNAATVVDGRLNYGGTVTGPNTSEGGTPALGVTGAGYTNNDADPATGTVLLDIDTDRDVLAVQNANPGVLTERGALGVDASEVAGFDVYTDGDRNTGIALLVVGGERGLYAVDLATGAVRFLTGVTRGVSELAIAP